MIETVQFNHPDKSPRKPPIDLSTPSRPYLIHPGRKARQSVHTVWINGYERSLILPDKFQAISPQQLQVLDRVLSAFEGERTRVVVLQAPCGCLAADTQINYTIRDENGRRVQWKGNTIEYLWKKFHNRRSSESKSDRIRNYKIPANWTIWVSSVDPKTAKIRHNLIENVIDNGMKEVFLLESKSGLKIKTTADHIFITPAGEVKMEDLVPGSKIWIHCENVRSNRRDGNRTKRNQEVMVRWHPVAKAKKVFDKKTGNTYIYHRLSHARLAFEANANGMSVNEYRAALNNGHFLKKENTMIWVMNGYEIHHKDKNPQNDSIENLELMTREEHQRLHTDISDHRRYAVEDEVVSVQKIGVEHVYDLTMRDEPNFFANGIAVHNCGKTLIAEVVRQCLEEQMLYVPPHIELQEQFKRDFTHSIVLTGRTNFEHGGLNGASDFPRITCGDCLDGSLCGEGRKSCRYNQVKKTFIESVVGVTNLSYFLAAANGIQMFWPASAEGFDADKAWGKWIGADGKWLTVIDEAHTVEDVIQGYLSVEIFMDRFRDIDMFVGGNGADLAYVRMAWPKPPLYDQEKNGWEYLVGVRDKMRAARVVADRVLEEVKSRIQESLARSGKIDDGLVKLSRKARGITALAESIEAVDLTQNEAGDWVSENWVYQPTRAMHQTKGRRVGDVTKVSFLPVRIDHMANDLLWRHLDRVLIMSGSWVGKESASDDLGLDRHGIDYRYIETDSLWDKRRMPIVQMSGANVTKDVKGRSWREQGCFEKLLSNAAVAIGKQRGESMILHSVSFELGNDLGGALAELFGRWEDGGRVMIHSGKRFTEPDSYGEVFPMSTSQEKAFLLDRFKRDGADRGLVLVSPSIEMGVDLPNDQCRGVMFAKCPWGDLGNRQIKKRMEQGAAGWRWYMRKTAMKLIQGAFRGCRWSGDWCRVWLLDEQFERILTPMFLYKWFLARVRSRGDIGCRPIDAYDKARE